MHTPCYLAAQTSPPASRRYAGLALAAGLHLAVFLALVDHAITPPSVTSAGLPIEVNLVVQPHAAAKAVLPPTPSKSIQPAVAHKAPPKPTPRAQTPTPPKEATAPVSEPAPANSAANAAPPATAGAAAGESPVPVTPARFDAAYLNNPAPAYPALSRSLGEQGRVVLRVLVNAQGRADQVDVRNSSGYPRLDEAAQATVKQWQFVPAHRAEQPLSAWVLVPIAFTLDG